MRRITTCAPSTLVVETVPPRPADWLIGSVICRTLVHLLTGSGQRYLRGVETGKRFTLSRAPGSSVSVRMPMFNGGENQLQIFRARWLREVLVKPRSCSPLDV